MYFSLENLCISIFRLNFVPVISVATMAWISFTLLFSVFLTSSAQQCTLFDNMIIGADSIDDLITSSAETCCSHCHANPRCIAFTYAVKEKTCYLKDNVASNSSAADRTSGTNGRPPPGPPGWSDACTQPGLKDFKFCDRSVPLSERVDDLVMRIQLNETGPLLTARQSIAIPRFQFSFVTFPCHENLQFLC